MDGHYAQSYGQPAPNYAPRYVMLSEHNGGIQPPPSRRNLPQYYSTKKSQGGGGGVCGLGCLCWCCCFLLLIIFAFAGVLIYTVVTLDPKPPAYKFKHFAVEAFRLQPDLSLHTQFAITVQAENPNRNIEISYGKGSMVALVYRGSMLCSGRLPEFHQSHENTTVLKVVLTGDSTFGSGLQQALTENTEANSIPLDVYIKIPVVLRVWSIDTRVLTVFLNCNLVVDSLSPHKKIGIISAKYKVNVKF